MDSGSAPGEGMVSFDHLLWSLLTLFTVTTLEGWHEVRAARGSVARTDCRVKQPIDSLGTNESRF